MLFVPNNIDNLCKLLLSTKCNTTFSVVVITSFVVVVLKLTLNWLSQLYSSSVGQSNKGIWNLQAVPKTLMNIPVKGGWLEGLRWDQTLLVKCQHLRPLGHQSSKVKHRGQGMDLGIEISFDWLNILWWQYN